jgi:hypothetical protein
MRPESCLAISRSCIFLLAFALSCESTRGDVPSGPDSASSDGAGGGSVTARYVYAALLGSTIGVYDIDDGHRRVKVIDNLQLRGSGVDVRGLSANARTHRLFLSYMSSSGGHVVCVDLLTDEVQWHRDYAPGVDRGDIGPAGDKLFVPTNEGQTATYELVVDPATGDVLGQVAVTAKSHDTDIGISGRFAYLETKSSNSIAVVDTSTDQVVQTIGPFTGIVGPHAVNGSDTLVVANVFGLYGFVIGNAQTGHVVTQVPILATPDPGGTGLRQHGVAWKPDETEVWVTGGAYMHVFDMRAIPPREAQLIPLSGYANTHWITFSIDGAYAYPSAAKNSGTPITVIDTKTYAPAATIDYSEDLVEVDFVDGVVTRVGDQFGIGRQP